jgi:hypothetical protein
MSAITKYHDLTIRSFNYKKIWTYYHFATYIKSFKQFFCTGHGSKSLAHIWYIFYYKFLNTKKMQTLVIVLFDCTLGMLYASSIPIKEQKNCTCILLFCISCSKKYMCKLQCCKVYVQITMLFIGSCLWVGTIVKQHIPVKDKTDVIFMSI